MSDQGPSIIPGIHQYCDHWCERCAFTHRCLAFEKPDTAPPVPEEMQGSAFGRVVSADLGETMQQLKKIAAKKGVDLDKVPEALRTSSRKRARRDTEHIQRDPLSVLSLEYARKAVTLLKDSPVLKTRIDELVDRYEMGIQSEDQLHKEVFYIKDCVEVIQWYLHFIFAKFSRALQGRLIHQVLEEEEDFSKDSDGSAKIALIAVDRSVDAWNKLFTSLGCEDEILPVLALLEKIRRLGETSFPDARVFKRPGFDD